IIAAPNFRFDPLKPSHTLSLQPRAPKLKFHAACLAHQLAPPTRTPRNRAGSLIDQATTMIWPLHGGSLLYNPFMQSTLGVTPQPRGPTKFSNRCVTDRRGPL